MPSATNSHDGAALIGMDGYHNFLQDVGAPLT